MRRDISKDDMVIVNGLHLNTGCYHGLTPKIIDSHHHINEYTIPTYSYFHLSSHVQ